MIVLLGSGETLPSSGKIHEYVARRLPPQPRVTILETPAGFEPNSAAVAGRIKQFLEQRLQNYEPRVEVLPARRRGTPFSPDRREIVFPILWADEILLGPGSPTYAVRQLRDSLALHLLATRQRRGATLFLSSAATLAFGRYTVPVYEIYKVGEDLHWQRGLDYFAQYGLPISIVPHWNNQDGGAELDTSRCYLGQERFRRLLAMLPREHLLVGIDEHTALIFDFEQGCCHVRGGDTVTLVQAGTAHTIQTGTTFPLSRLGAWQIPSEADGLDPALWQEAIQAEAARAQAEAGPPGRQPPASVQSLLQARAEARARQEWALADSLREQIAALGWEVRDTPQGSDLFPL